MPRKRPANGTVQLNVWISVEAKNYLDERYKREGLHRNEQIEALIRQDMAVRSGEIIEQDSLPVISEIVEAKLQKHFAHFRTDLRQDMQFEILEPVKTVIRSSDNRLAGLIVRAVRDAGIIRRFLYALVAKQFGAAFAKEAHHDAKEKAGQELAARTTAQKEAN
jgi:hypothetical protein